MLRHQVGYCTAPDGVRLAYAIAGSGPPLIKVPTHLNHTGFDSTLVGARHWFEALASRNTLIWHDLRGAGLSDRNPPSMEFEDWVSDLDVVVNHLGLERFALIGISMAGATSIAYAALHPERVTHLILHAPKVRALNRHVSERGRAKFEAYKGMIRQFWDAPDRRTRSLFADIVEYAPPEVQDALDEVRRAAISPELRHHVISIGADIDVTDLLPRVRTPTLVTHAKGDNMVRHLRTRRRRQPESPALGSFFWKARTTSSRKTNRGGRSSWTRSGLSWASPVIWDRSLREPRR